ncbi:efflux transporter outer membrane subunit [Komagataeibacter xylinus]|uniref:efflux transporter outer membrane subunit n=1 Tax=Komagataeibacter xylinus TaxID=28448 RepID=UPI00102FAB0E|nr:efflux transporter outer membrane subunit [Komagataeibacter xylinus]
MPSNFPLHTQRPKRGAAAPRPAWLALVALLPGLTGCTVGPTYKAPQPPNAATFGETWSETATIASSNSPYQAIGKSGSDWWYLFRSPRLDALVTESLRNNWSIQAAQANLRKAAEGLHAAQGSLMPQIDATGAEGRQEYGASLFGPWAWTFPAFSAYSAGLDLSYDPDIFGGNHRLIEMAGAQKDAERERRDVTMLLVVGDTVLTAFEAASTADQIAVIRGVIDTDRETLRLATLAWQAGRRPRLDVVTAEAQLAHDQSLLPSLINAHEAARTTLAVLTGHSPANWTAPILTLADFSLPPDIPVVVPSNLVHARPDIIGAEAMMRATNAEIGARTADLYPRLTLSAAAAAEGLMGGPAGAAWRLIGGAALPLFHGGTLKARKKQAEEDYRIAFDHYQSVVINGFREVADSLNGLKNASTELDNQRQALTSADDALTLSQAGYQAGRENILQPINARRLVLLARQNTVRAQTEMFRQTVRIMVATGGGLADAHVTSDQWRSVRLAAR